MTNIGIRFKIIRQEKHLTQKALGDILGVSKQAIANIETGHNNPSIEIIGKLIENLNINSNWLIIGKGEVFNSIKNDDFTTKVEDILKKNGLI